MPRIRLLLPAVAALCVAFFGAPATAATYSVYFTVNAAQEVPTNTSCGTAFGKVTVNTVANTLTFEIQQTAALTGSETAAHIHGPAAPGVNAGVKFTLPAGFPKTGVWTYLEADEASITSGLMYVNVHSSFKAGGEIRGQIPAQPVSVTRDQAAGVVIHDVILPSSNQPDLGAYGPVSLVPAGATIRDRATDGPVIVTVPENAWYFWIDDRQDQRFGHAVRHVLVSATTGAVLSVTPGQFWPVANGVTYYETLAEREATTDRIWPLATGNPGCVVTEPQNSVEPAPERLIPPIELQGRDRVRAPSRVEAASTWAFVGCGVDTSKDRNFKADFDSMRAWFGDGNPQGPQIPAGGIRTLVNPTKAQFCAMLDTLPKNCDKFYFYWCGHGDTIGGKLVLKNDEEIAPAEVISKIKKLGSKEVCITIDACYSGHFIRVFGDSGLTGSCSTAADSLTPGLSYKKRAFGTGGIYTQARLSCLRAGLMGPDLEAWARDSVARYMARRNAACPMNPLPYPNPQYAEGMEFGGPGYMPFTAGGDSCKTVCIRFPGDTLSHTCANSTVYCESFFPFPHFNCVRAWNWNTGRVRYFNATTDPFATGNYVMTLHSNAYPVTVVVQWLATVGLDTPSSTVNFPAWSLGWPNDNLEFGHLIGPLQTVILNDGLDLLNVPGMLGIAGTQVIEIDQNLLGDPTRPFMHVGGDPSQPFGSPGLLTLGATFLMDEAGFPVTSLPVDVQVLIDGLPHAHQVGNFITTGIATGPPTGSPAAAQAMSAAIPLPAMRPGFVQISLSIPGAVGTATLDYMRLDFQGPPTLGVDPEPVARGILRLLSPWPNPSAGRSRIRFELPRAAHALLRVYDVTGRAVSTVANERFTAGMHTVDWNGVLAHGNPAANGVYYVALEVEGRRLTSRFVLLH